MLGVEPVSYSWLDTYQYPNKPLSLRIACLFSGPFCKAFRGKHYYNLNTTPQSRKSSILVRIMNLALMILVFPIGIVSIVAMTCKIVISSLTDEETKITNLVKKAADLRNVESAIEEFTKFFETQDWEKAIKCFNQHIQNNLHNLSRENQSILTLNYQRCLNNNLRQITSIDEINVLVEGSTVSFSSCDPRFVKNFLKAILEKALALDFHNFTISNNCLTSLPKKYGHDFNFFISDFVNILRTHKYERFLDKARALVLLNQLYQYANNLSQSINPVKISRAVWISSFDQFQGQSLGNAAEMDLYFCNEKLMPKLDPLWDAYKSAKQLQKPKGARDSSDVFYTSVTSILSNLNANHKHDPAYRCIQTHLIKNTLNQSTFKRDLNSAQANEFCNSLLIEIGLALHAAAKTLQK